MKETIINWLAGIPYAGYHLQNKYVFSLLILVISALLAKLLLLVFAKVLEKFAAKTKTKFDDMLFDHTKKPLFYLILVYGLKLSLLNLEINGFTERLVDSAMALVFLFIMLRAIDVAVETWAITFSKRTKTKLDDVLLPLLHKMVRVFFVVVGLLWVFKIWQIDITPYLAGVGISGLVLGLALQDSLKNIFGGITLLLDKTYQYGDKIKLETGEVGTIHDIGLRSTKIITFDSEVIYVPNGYLANSRVLNYTRPDPKVRAHVFFGVEYGTDVKKVEKVVMGVLTKMHDVMEDPAPTVIFLEMGDFALKFRANFWVDKWDKSWNKKIEATEKIYDALRKAKIGIPFPTQTLYLKKEK